MKTTSPRKHRVATLPELALAVRSEVLAGGGSERAATGAEALIVQIVALLEDGRPWIGRQEDLARQLDRGVWSLRRYLRLLGELGLIEVTPLGPQGCSIRAGERLNLWLSDPNWGMTS